jgi:pyridoxine 5-phosphate synthase
VTRLSVNVNKIATLRNSRTVQEGRARGVPSVVEAARVCVEAGAHGITVHPRPDARHITFADVRDLAELLAPLRDTVELNIEGDPREDLVDLVLQVAPHQFTLVPVRPGEVTSQAGWPADTPPGPLRRLIVRMHAAGIRVSMFVDPDEAPIKWAAHLGADRIELFTEPFAAGHLDVSVYARAAEVAHRLGLGVNAGHDLDHQNLPVFRRVPHLDEVSIGHAIMAEAVFDGLRAVVERYVAILRAPR